MRRTAERRRQLAAAIEACRDADGVIKKTAIVEAAKNTASDLHAEFDWDLASAAHTAWLMRAGELMAEVRDIIEYRGREIAVPRYVPNPSKVDGGHVRTMAVATNAALKAAALKAELDRIRAAIIRARSLSMAFDLEREFDTLLQQVVDIELHLEPA